MLSSIVHHDRGEDGEEEEEASIHLDLCYHVRPDRLLRSEGEPYRLPLAERHGVKPVQNPGGV